jgi:hypothetical protein
MKEYLVPIMLERETEKLRQEKETFDRRKDQEKRWFRLRLVMGYSAVILLLAIMFVSSWIVLNHQAFPGSVVAGASAAFFGDVLGLLICVWKIVLNPSFMTKPEPTTSTVHSCDEIIEEPGLSSEREIVVSK